MRLAFIVSHPIQYYAPIYREMAKRGGMEIRVFYTWRNAEAAHDVKFGTEFAWDIPLMEGYESEVVPNISTQPGTHHRWGLVNPDLMARVMAWRPDAVHITGYNYVSHGRAIKDLSQAGIPVLFRGDSHLLDGRGPWWKWWAKKILLTHLFRRPAAFPYVGEANRNYYRAFGVPEHKLFYVPHTIEVERFSEPDTKLEAKAQAWRREIGIPDHHTVFLYAAKLESRKRPMELLEAFLRADIPETTLLFAGSGALESKLKAEAQKIVDIARHVIFLPFQNQSVMPLVYRLGDILVLPSGYGETWGLAVNEAQACGRPALVSDCVGCAPDIIRCGDNGLIFRTDDWEACAGAMRRASAMNWLARREEIRLEAQAFGTQHGVEALENCLRQVSSCGGRGGVLPVRSIGSTHKF